MRKAYQTDLSDAEWSCLEPHLPIPKATGRPKLHSTREILNAIFYIVRGGCCRSRDRSEDCNARLAARIKTDLIICTESPKSELTDSADRSIARRAEQLP